MDTIHQFYSGKHVAVLGGNGMLGSYIVDLLVEAGATVIVQDINPCHYRPTPPNVEEDLSDVTHGFGGGTVAHGWFDLIINCAAKVTGIVWNEKHHCDMALANIGLTVGPLKECIDFRFERYVYLSSACVYPAEADVPTEEHWGWVGDPEPTNYGYGFAKRAGEKLCMLAHEEHPWFKPLVLRPSNMYSPRENWDDPNAHVIPRTIARVLSGENPIVMRGTGKALRSFLHAREAAEGVLLAAMTDHVGILNLPAAAPGISIYNLASMICDVADSNAVVRFSGEGSDGYPRRLSSNAELDSVLANHGLSWTPKTSLRSGLTETIQGCKNWFEKKSNATP